MGNNKHSAQPGGTPAGKLDPETADARFMLSLARGLLVLHAFEHSYDLTVSAASRMTGLSRATVRRCFYTLQRLGYVTEEPDGFVLSSKLLGLANVFRRSTNVAEAIRRTVKGLMEKTGESCVFGMFEGTEVTAVANATPAKRVISIDLETKIPLHCSAIGRVCLAGQTARRLDAYLRRVPFAKFTHKTRCTATELRAAIDEVRQQDYAYIDEELELGLRSVAVPVRNSMSETTGALCVVTVRQLSSADIKRLVRQANSLARDLGAHMDGPV